jgi:hypothetical protein
LVQSFEVTGNSEKENFKPFPANFKFVCGKWNVKIIFLIGIVGGGVQLGALGTTATNRPTVPALGDYDGKEIDGMMIARGNGSNRRKPVPVPLCPPQTPHALPGREAGPPRWEASD